MTDNENGQPNSANGGKVSRRTFLRGVGALGAATALGTALHHNGDAAAHAADAPESLLPPPGPLTVHLNVNGETRIAHVEARTTLLNALRNHLDPAVTGPKLVCDRGACGACTVDMGGKTVNSCMVLAADAEGKAITTIEGLAAADGSLHPIQAAFCAHDALMCGFCTPGFVMSVRSLLAHNPHPTREEVAEACSGNLCRCGTYPRIFEAAMAVSQKTT